MEAEIKEYIKFLRKQIKKEEKEHDRIMANKNFMNKGLHTMLHDKSITFLKSELEKFLTPKA